MKREISLVLWCSTRLTLVEVEVNQPLLSRTRFRFDGRRLNLCVVSDAMDRAASAAGLVPSPTESHSSHSAPFMQARQIRPNALQRRNCGRDARAHILPTTDQKLCDSETSQVIIDR